MAAITFTSVNGRYEGVISNVSDDIHVHIEKAAPGRMELQQKAHSATNYANVEGFSHKEQIFDSEIPAQSVAMDFKFISYVAVDSASY